MFYPNKVINQLQLIQNSVARALTMTRRTELVTPVLKLAVFQFSIDFKILTCFKSGHGLAAYLPDIFLVINQHELSGPFKYNILFPFMFRKSIFVIYYFLSVLSALFVKNILHLFNLFFNCRVHWSQTVFNVIM